MNIFLQILILLILIFDIVINIIYSYKSKYITVKVKKLYSESKKLKLAKKGDAGVDVFSIHDQLVPAHSSSIPIYTGLALEIPPGYYIQIVPRSGLSRRTGIRISNSPATIDSSYRGELIILIDNVSNEDYFISAYDRIAQIIIKESITLKFKYVKQLSDTDRGSNGFGSTGK